MELRLAMLYGGKVGGMKQRSGWLHPKTEFYDVGVGERKSKAQRVGTLIHGRIVNGPELNIILLGVPFLISSAAGAIRAEVKEKAKKKEAKANAARPAAQRDKAITNEAKMRIKPQTPPQKLQADALPSAPYSSEFVKVRQELVDLGMSPNMATALVKGEFESESVDDVLSDEDFDALLAFLEKYS
ncbi:hypothetical protein [Falsiroseomonas oryziterrae]|uniref:hypothetical protein n=1 Tax=Falsiroseomonas oryziterrae TaxID=2911368 RepID=UPI001F1ACA59|nr:hypothetical protein [Roseomonas sp. NPKOSM-4]